MARERTKKKRDGAAVEGSPAAAAAAAIATNAAPPPYNGSDVPPWPRWAHPRPDPYYGAPLAYGAYEWTHPWPSPHMRAGGAASAAGGAGIDANFPGDFGGYPKAGYPFPAAGMQPVPGPIPPSATPPPASTVNSSPPRASPHSTSNGDSQSDGSSFSDGETAAQDPDDGSKQVRKRKSSGERKTPAGKEPKGKLPGEENSAKNKRYGIEEVKDLVKFRTDLQGKFETMSTHLDLWTSIGDKMSERGHPKRQWESYRDKWDIELRRYQKELKSLLSQAGLSENKELEHPEQLVFSDEILQEIHSRLNFRPRAALRSRFQSGVGGARGCLNEDPTAATAPNSAPAAAASAAAATTATPAAREVAGKRMKKSANNQLLVDSIVEKVVEKVGTFDDTASAQGFKEVFDAVVNLTNILVAESSGAAAAQPTEFEIDNQVFEWLKSIGKDQYASYFAASHVDWTNLLLLDKDDLVEMKIPIGPRKFILKELEKIRPSSQAVSVNLSQEQV